MRSGFGGALPHGHGRTARSVGHAAAALLMRAALISLAAFGLTASSAAAQSRQPAHEAAARTVAADTAVASAERAARAWLELLDERAYERAWAQVAPAMRSAVGYQQWTTSLTQLRSALPRSPRRDLLHAEPSVPLFGGNSIIMSFTVGRDSMREIVVLVRRSERWEMGGYGILLY